MAKTWLITGCSTGFGRLLCQAAFDRGDKVVATARRVDTLADLCCNGDEDRVLRLTLDVTNDSDIENAVRETIQAFGRIDVLVNNAGYGYFSIQEECELNEVRSMYETNVFGLINVTQKVVPHLRQQGEGCVMNVSSIAGNIGTPRGGFYQSTKWAVEALSESLYLETCSFGVRVVLIQPGLYETDFGPRSARVSKRDQDPSSPYVELKPRWRENASREVFHTVQDPREVVQAMLDAADSSKPFLRVPLGQDARSLIQRREEMADGDFVAWMREMYHG